MPETHNIEYKESWRDEYLRQICGMANAHGGSVFIGIDDSGKIIGVSKAKKLQEDIPNKVKDTLCIVPEVVLHTDGGKDYLEIIVPENATPVSFKNKFYYRSGTVTIELMDTSLHTFLLDKMGGHWDSMPVEGVNVGDLDQESFDIFERESIRSGRMTRPNYPKTREDLLDKLHLLTTDGRLTRAAVLLFHRNPEKWVLNAYSKIAKFGKGADLRYHDQVHGSLMMQADRMMDLIYTKYLIPRIRYANKTRIETYPYPYDSVREGYFNALMHNFYMKCVPIQIRINEDEMWISNDVAFNSRWTPEALMSTHRSEPYNTLIANAFFWAGFVETWGRGIQEMCEGCIEYGCPMPSYVEQPSGLMLIFKAHPDTIGLQNGEIEYIYEKNDKKSDEENGEKSDKKVSGKSNKKNDELKDYKAERNGKKSISINTGVGTKKSSKKVARKSSKKKDALLSFLTENASITYAQLAKKLGMSVSGVRKIMDDMRSNGKIQRVGSDRSGQWIIVSGEEDGV